MSRRLRAIFGAFAAAATIAVTLIGPPTVAATVEPATCAFIGDSHFARMGSASLYRELDAAGKCTGGRYFYGCGGKQMISRDACGRKSTLQNLLDAKAALGEYPD